MNGLKRTEESQSSNNQGQLSSINGTCKYRFCNTCVNSYRSKKAPLVLYQLCNVAEEGLESGKTCGEIWKISGQYTCPVCLGICECLSCMRNKQNYQNRMQKMLKNMDKNENQSSMSMLLQHH